MHYENADELAQRLRTSRAHIYNMIPLGLPSVKIGRSRRFISDEVDAWIRERNAESARIDK